MGAAVRFETSGAVPALDPGSEFAASIDASIARARDALLELQRPEGYWQAPLEANAQMNAEFIIFNHFMQVEDPDLESRLANFLLERQQADGSWNLFKGGEGYLSYTIEAYVALKLAGMPVTDQRMAAARSWILSRGGIEKAGTLARFYLAAIGQVPWRATTAVPVEITLLPNWFPINVYSLASWARGTLFALSILQALRPRVEVDNRRSALELYSGDPAQAKFRQPAGEGILSLRGIFNVADRILRSYDRHHLKRLRARAISHAENWILNHQEQNGSFGGIQPCYLLSTMALKALGYSNEHPVIRNALRACRELIWPMTDKALCMPCVSPNWDTALAVRALKDAGLHEEHPALAKAASWFIDQQVFKRGDWAVKRPDLEPGGWPFEFFNDAYPDVDDSAIIVSNLAEMSFDDRAARDRAIKAGANWVIGMQSSDGGFAAFDVDSKSGWLNQLPLADVEAVTDPTCPDLTGRALEMMGAVGYDRDYPAAQRAIEWLKREQEREGSWWGRWGVNHIYGTFSALCGLRAVGVDMEEEWIGRAVKWLKSKQNADGGWGEACLSDRDASWRGCGRSTPSQTSWALMGLLAGEKGIDESATRAVKWLLENQNSAGVWEESESTGNGFPNHFYLRYYLYPHYFPLMALGRFRRRLLERPE